MIYRSEQLQTAERIKKCFVDIRSRLLCPNEYIDLPMLPHKRMAKA